MRYLTGQRLCMALALAAALDAYGMAASPADAGESAISVSQAWTPAAARGVDTPLFTTISNAGAVDALLRSRCTAANFTEQHFVDHGEGFPSMRAVKSIPVAANGVTRLDADGYHVMLLQTVCALAAGETFACSLSFRDTGKRDIEVTVGTPE